MAQSTESAAFYVIQKSEMVDTGMIEMPTTVLGMFVDDARYLVQMNKISEMIQIAEIVSVPRYR